MHNIFLNEVDENGRSVTGGSKGRRVAVIPRADEMFILDNAIYTVLAVAHDFDQEEVITYLTIRFIRHCKDGKNANNLN